MKKSTMAWVGLALGTVVGAMLVEEYQPAKELVCKSKQKIMDKFNRMNNNF